MTWKINSYNITVNSSQIAAALEQPESRFSNFSHTLTLQSMSRFLLSELVKLSPLKIFKRFQRHRFQRRNRFLFCESLKIDRFHSLFERFNLRYDIRSSQESYFEQVHDSPVKKVGKKRASPTTYREIVRASRQCKIRKRSIEFFLYRSLYNYWRVSSARKAIIYSLEHIR